MKNWMSLKLKLALPPLDVQDIFSALGQMLTFRRGLLGPSDGRNKDFFLGLRGIDVARWVGRWY